MIRRRGPKFFAEASKPITSARPLTSKIPAIKMKAIAAAKQPEHIEDESIGAREEPFLVAERRHHLRARLIQQRGHGNELVAFGAKPINHSRQSLDGVAAIAAAVVHQDDIALVGCRVGEHALHDRVRGRRKRRHSARPNRAGSTRAPMMM